MPKDVVVNRNFENKVEQMPIVELLTLVHCAGSFRFGGNWGYIRTSHPEFETLKEEFLGADKNVVTIQKVANGALVLAKREYLSKVANELLPGIIDGNFIQHAKHRESDERKKFLTFVERVLKEKSKHVIKKNGYSELTLGIYSSNEVNAIRINGEDYPAYRLTAQEALKAFMMKGQELGRETFVKTSDSFIPIKTIQSSDWVKVFGGLEISDSDTGVFITLRIR